MLVLPKEKCWYYQKRDVRLQPGPQGHQISSFCHENETAIILAQTWDSSNSQTYRSFSLFKAISWLPISALVFGLMNSQSDWFQQEYISCRLHLWTFPGWHSKPQYIGSFPSCHKHETFGFKNNNKNYIFPVQSSLPASLGFSLMAIRADYEIITLHNSASLPLSDGLFDFLDDNIFV